jgi:hypothetical protein
LKFTAVFFSHDLPVKQWAYGRTQRMGARLVYATRTSIKLPQQPVPTKRMFFFGYFCRPF